MNKTSKFLFLGLTLLILLVSVGAISATDSDNSQVLSDDNTDIIHETNTEKLVDNTKKVETQNKNIKKSENKNVTKKITKTDKQPKKAAETTQTATDYETLKQSWNNIKNEGDNTTDYTINVKNGEYKFTEELEINTTSNIKSITINGEDKDKTIFNGQNTTRHFNLNNPTLIVNFNNITFTNGVNDSTAGSIYANSIVKINNSNFINNSINTETTKKIYGGAIYALKDLEVYNSNFENNNMYASNRCSGYGGAVASTSKVNLNMNDCRFTNNIIRTGGYQYGGAISLTVSGTIANITNCEFTNNSGTREPFEIYPTSCRGYDIYLDRPSNNVTVIRCVFNTEGSVYQSSYIPSNVGYNYYSPGSFSGRDLIVFVNDKNNFNIANQKNSNVTIQLYKDETYYAHPISDIVLGVNKSFNITSSSDLINTTGISLSPSNNYTAVVDISNLPVKHEDVSLYMDGVEVAKVVYNYTNVEFNNITAKPGNTVDIKVKLTSNNKELIQNGKVAFKINGKTIGHANVNIGVASIKYIIPENYSAKDYILTVVCGGSRDFIEARMNATLHLAKIKTSTNLTTNIEGNTLKITVDPRDENGNTVKTGKICVKIEGKTLQTLKINGKTTVNFTIPKSWNNREIKILAIYGENNNHKESRTEIKTKLTLPNTKITKTDEAINNYYVSDATGSDSNTGSSDNPFKTIQKAISTVNTNKQPANIYLDGNFKGVGNTNLTIPGDLKINFIGVGNSSIDGEVNYTFSGDTGVWGSSAIWEAYQNGKGNWAMNIAKGTGLITITNFTIKNCWNPGGSSIDAYKTATIDNYGNLEVNNVSFIFNHGGIGASIRNNNGSTLKVTNSNFEANRKSSSTGNYGAGIYNNGTAVVINSTFHHNYGRWGTITNDKNLTIINSTIRDNIGYDGGSTYKSGSGIAINTGSSDFFQSHDIVGIITVIDGCYFTNNDQLDISAGKGNLNITNCVFNRSTGLYGANGGNNTLEVNIINNTVIEPQGSTLQTSLSSSDLVKYSFYLGSGYKYLIENNTGINLTCAAIQTSNAYNSNGIENAIIRNNIFDNNIIIYNGNNNLIENNNITTKTEYAIILNKECTNNTIVKNHLVSSQFEGDAAVSYQSTTNTVVNNTPKTSILRINENNFFQFFDDDGNLKADYQDINQIILLTGLNNEVMVLNANTKISQQNSRLLSNNLTIIVKDTGSINATTLKILNTNNQPVFILNTDNNIITNSNLTTNDTNAIIINNTKNNTITGNILIADINVGDEAVSMSNNNNITSNTPAYRQYLVEDNTYNTYFDENGNIKNLPADKEIHLLIGNLNNKTLILNNNRTINITNYHEISQQNITIKTEDATILLMGNMTITNTNNKPVVEIKAPSNKIAYTNLTSNTNVITIENAQSTTIEYNNITSNTTDDVKTIILRNTKNTNIYTNNITTISNIKDDKKHTITAIDAYNVTSFTINHNVINTISNGSNDDVYSINMINPELYDVSVYNRITSNTITTTATNNAYSINLVNQTLSGSDNKITTNGKNTVAIKATTSNQQSTYSYITSETTIISNAQINNTGIIFDSCKDIFIIRINMTLKGENVVGILNINCTNENIQSINITIEGNNTSAIKLNKTNMINITYNNITVTSKNINKAPVELNNAQQTLIANNTVITTTQNTIKIDKESSKNKVCDNILYALSLGDESVAKESNNYITVMDNTPVKSYKNLLLSDNTYSAFFDENGVLRDDVPTAANITLVGDLHNKVLNITRPINIVGNNLLGYINTSIIIGPSAKNTNITGSYMEGYDNTRVIIEADGCNIQIPTITLQNSEDKNITLMIIKGNNNNLVMKNMTTLNNPDKSPNANITHLVLTGKQNNILINAIGSKHYMKLNEFNNSTAIILNHANNNRLNISGYTDYTQRNPIEADNGIILNNSNNNQIFTSTKSSITVYGVGFYFINSSNNIIYKAAFQSCGNESKLLLLENNSNHNKIFGVFVSYTTFNVTPVSIINSSYNLIQGCKITTSSEHYPIEILNGFENEITQNFLSSANVTGNKAVYQETDNDEVVQNNNIHDNNAISSGYQQLYTTITGNIKVHQTITINVRDGDFGNRGGNYTFIVNGKTIATVESSNSLASINYTITGDEGDELIVTVIFVSNRNFVTNSTAYSITKLDSNIILPNVTSTNGKTTLSAIILDEEGNIQSNGKVAFKLNGKTYGVVKIENGIAQLTVDSSKLSAKNYTITAVYGGNTITAKSTQNATLTITKSTPKIQMPSTTKRTNNTQITINITDENGNKINSNQKVCIKFNGCTITNTKAVNGTVKVNLDLTQYKNKQYNMTVICGENSLYNTSRLTNTLVIE